MLSCKIKCRKNKRFFFACEVTALTITLHASHRMAAVKTASNIDRGDTIAQVATRDATNGGKAISTTSAGLNPCPCAFARWQNLCPCAFTGILIRKVNYLPSINSA